MYLFPMFSYIRFFLIFCYLQQLDSVTASKNTKFMKSTVIVYMIYLVAIEKFYMNFFVFLEVYTFVCVKYPPSAYNHIDLHTCEWFLVVYIVGEGKVFGHL